MPSATTTRSASNHDYDDVLPSLNLAYDLTDDTKLRFTAARVMTRPDFTDIAPRASLNPGALTGTSGNPDLDPYRANQADLSIEWYPDNNSIIALGLYYKDIESFITDSPVTLDFPVESATQPATACTQTGPTTWQCPFLINQRTNGGGGRIYGAEFAITWPIAGGFGVQANYTYSNAEADNGDPIPGNSENSYNLAAYFENERVSARLAYTYRSEFFVTFDRSTQLNQDDLKSLDASVSVNVTRSPGTDLRRREPDERGDRAVRDRLVPATRGLRQRTDLLRRRAIQVLKRPLTAGSHRP